MSRSSICFTLILIYNVVNAQTLPKRYISSITYNISSGFREKEKKGVIKYEYDVYKRLSGLALYNGNNLNDVKKFKFKYSFTNLSIMNTATQVGQNSTLNTDGRLSVLNYSYGDSREPYGYEYKFKYFSNGFLERVNSYSDSKLIEVHDFTYEDDNLSKIINSFYLPRRGTYDYYFTYYDEPAIDNYNLVFSFYQDLNSYEFPLYAVPSKLIGKQSKNLLKKVTIYNTRTSDEWILNITYEKTSEGLIDKMIVDYGNGKRNVFTFSYL